MTQKRSDGRGRSFGQGHRSGGDSQGKNKKKKKKRKCLIATEGRTTGVREIQKNHMPKAFGGRGQILNIMGVLRTW